MEATKKKRGRPAKIRPDDTQQVTMELSLDTHARMRAQMDALKIRHPATFVTYLVNADVPLLSLLQQRDSEIAEMRRMFHEMKSMMRVVQSTQSDLMRALEIEPTDQDFGQPQNEPGPDFAEEFEAAEDDQVAWWAPRAARQGE